MNQSHCACNRLRRASRALTRLYDGALAAAGLTTTQFAILRASERLGPASVSALARLTGHERSAMTRNLRPLASAGLVAVGEGADMRSRGVAITALGRTTVARAEPAWQAVQNRVEAQLGAADRQQLRALLARLEAIGNGAVP